MESVSTQIQTGIDRKGISPRHLPRFFGSRFSRTLYRAYLWTSDNIHNGRRPSFMESLHVVDLYPRHCSHLYLHPPKPSVRFQNVKFWTFLFRSVFKRYRSAIIFFIRLVMLIGHVKFSLYLEVPKASFTAIIFLIMTRSPLPSMVFMAMSHRLEFRNHLILQSIALIEAIFWIPPFCKTCSTNNTVMNTFTKVRNLLLRRKRFVFRWEMGLIVSFPLLFSTRSWIIGVLLVGRFRL